jgi:hypothetical protein
LFNGRIGFVRFKGIKPVDKLNSSGGCCVTHRGTAWFSHQREGGPAGRAPACQKKAAIEKALLMNYAAPVQGLPFSRWRA